MGAAGSVAGNSLRQGLMAVEASSRAPLNTLASMGGAAQGERVERSCRADRGPTASRDDRCKMVIIWISA
jgi:hypothetical protein